MSTPRSPFVDHARRVDIDYRLHVRLVVHLRSPLVYNYAALC